MTFDKRAHNPYLVASGLTDKPTPMPWFGNKTARPPVRLSAGAVSQFEDRGNRG